MSDEKKGLQLERRLLSCGFTQKDIKMIYEKAGGNSSVDVIKIIKTISYTSIFLSSLLIVAIVLMIVSSVYSNEELHISFISISVALVVAVFAINLVLPFKIGIKSSLFLLKNDDLIK